MQKDNDSKRRCKKASYIRISQTLHTLPQNSIHAVETSFCNSKVKQKINRGADSRVHHTFVQKQEQEGSRHEKI